MPKARSPHLFVSPLGVSYGMTGTIPSGGVAAFMRRAVAKANKKCDVSLTLCRPWAPNVLTHRLAIGLAENIPAESGSVPQGTKESVGDLLRAVREQDTKIHVDLGSRVPVGPFFMYALRVWARWLFAAGSHVGKSTDLVLSQLQPHRQVGRYGRQGEAATGNVLRISAWSLSPCRFLRVCVRWLILFHIWRSWTSHLFGARVLVERPKRGLGTRGHRVGPT